MPEIDENVKLQRITKFLEMGGTMLAASHDCGAPMFRYQGKTFCPVCDVGEEKKAPGEPGMTGPKTIRQDLGAIIKNKIQNIASSLEGETDLQRLKDKLECIELGIRIIRSINGTSL